MAFGIGDRVRFLNDPGGGRITGFPSETVALVEDESGFSFEHPVTELVLIENYRAEWEKYDSIRPDLREILDRNIDQELTNKAETEFKLIYKNPQASSERRRGELMEVDLHAHELIDSQKGMSNTEIIQHQIEHFERMIRIAEERKIPRIVFIHGVGQGVLRAEIRRILSEYYPRASFHDAPYNEYGYGATEVRIRFS